MSCESGRTQWGISCPPTTPPSPATSSCMQTGTITTGVAISPQDPSTRDSIENWSTTKGGPLGSFDVSQFAAESFDGSLK